MTIDEVRSLEQIPDNASFNRVLRYWRIAKGSLDGESVRKHYYCLSFYEVAFSYLEDLVEESRPSIYGARDLQVQMIRKYADAFYLIESFRKLTSTDGDNNIDEDRLEEWSVEKLRVERLDAFLFEFQEKFRKLLAS